MTAPVRDGVLPVDKPEGPTSHDVVQVVRRALSERRVGHTGTLDPFATGLMLMCVGRATRIAEFLSGLDKSYEAVARLGRTTDTLDREGATIREDEGWRDLDESRVLDVLRGFVGAIAQVPPQFSARKIDGVPMHRRARRGEHVELAPRPVTIHALELVEMSPPDVHLRVRCSSGTYVRALARDVGEALGVGAHLVELRRIAVGRFTVDRALDLDRVADRPSVASAWLSPLEALSHLPTVRVDADAVRALELGQRIVVEGQRTAPAVAVAFEGSLVAVGEVSDDVFQPRKVFLG